MKDLQEIINKKAAAKLDADLRQLHDLPYNKLYHLFRDSKIIVNVGTSEKPRNISLASVFGRDGFYQQLYDKNIERYIENESKEFVQRVEELQSQIDELYDR
jgi:aminoglycoside phosphotransferase